MEQQERPRLNREIANARVSMEYPHVIVCEANDAIALVVPSLEKGDLPLMCEHNGTKRLLGKIRRSILVLEVLLRVSPIKYVKSETECYDIVKARDLLEVI